MAKSSRPEGTEIVIDPKGLGGMIGVLTRQGYTVIGPVLRDGAIDWQPVESVDDLPSGWTAEQSPGKYRIAPRNDSAFFGYSVGQSGLKRFLHQPDVRLFAVESNGQPFHILENHEEPPLYAFLGVRACDLAALGILDRVLLEDRYPDSLYRDRRQRMFIVAVNCSEPSSSCFCTSMGLGPQVESGFDVVLTEVISPDAHCFLAKAGTERGRELLKEVEHTEATAEIRKRAAGTVESAVRKITRKFDAAGLSQTLYDHFEHPQWDQVAARCLGCGNCTQVCPTCFCVTVEDSSSIDGQLAERRRKWDSCFTLSHSYIHGGSVRQSAKARYRQWVTHKFAAWQEQFGTQGCSGCGRCITWCPAGIDVTEVAAAVGGGPGANRQLSKED